MAELADALDLGSSAREGVGVQVSPGARRISEMRTRFSDLVFSYWGNSVVTAAASRAVCGGSHLPVAHAGAASRPAYPPCAGLASCRPSEPLFHHAISKRPDHQLHAIMCSRLCHGGRQVSLHRGRL